MSKFAEILAQAKIVQTVQPEWTLGQCVQHLKDNGIGIITDFDVEIFNTYDEETMKGFERMFN